MLTESLLASFALSLATLLPMEEEEEVPVVVMTAVVLRADQLLLCATASLVRQFPLAQAQQHGEVQKRAWWQQPPVRKAIQSHGQPWHREAEEDRAERREERKISHELLLLQPLRWWRWHPLRAICLDMQHVQGNAGEAMQGQTARHHVHSAL